MEVIIKPRGHGKTTKALALAQKTNSNLIVSSSQEAHYLNHELMRYYNNSIRAITMEQVERGLARGVTRNFIIDDADRLLTSYLRGGNITAITVSGECPNIKKQDSWLPGKTAPKDGTEFLARWENNIHKMTHVIYYEESEKSCPWLLSGSKVLQGFAEQPDFWMPIPSLTASATQEAGTDKISAPLTADYNYFRFKKPDKVGAME